ncbi:hypothetical protein K4K53_005032 [Colletotrichum sp. SAR 10_77]|nr:hypothetical protein K4K53_005032 [Colletotrichum sp. SAR 10_77]
MRFSIAIIIAILAAVCAADRMVTTRRRCSTPGGFIRCSHRGEYFVNSGRKFTFSDAGGCDTRGIPEMAEFCIDYGKNRAHFRFNNQHKRCLGVKSTSGAVTEWKEIKCSWKRDEDWADEVGEASEDGPAPIDLLFDPEESK